MHVNIKNSAEWVGEFCPLSKIKKCRLEIVRKNGAKILLDTKQPENSGNKLNFELLSLRAYN